MPKLLDREPTQEMLKAIASSDCAPSNYKRMFQSAYDAAPDVKQEPVAEVVERLDEDRYFKCEVLEGAMPCVGVKLFALPPDAQAEIRERDARISRLENELADALDLKAGNGPTALAMQAARIKELEEKLTVCVFDRDTYKRHLDTRTQQHSKQAAEISRLREVLAKCKKALNRLLFHGNTEWATTAGEEALAAIKEEGL